MDEGLSKQFYKDLDNHRARVGKMEQRIEGLIELMADGERSDYIRRKLRTLEAQAKDEHRMIAALESQTKAREVVIPCVDEIVTAALELNKVLQRTPRARASHRGGRRNKQLSGSASASSSIDLADRRFAHAETTTGTGEGVTDWYPRRDGQLE